MFRCVRSLATPRAVPARAGATFPGDVPVAVPAPSSARAAAFAVMLLGTLLLSACASPFGRDGKTPFELTEDDTNRTVSYTVQRGDRLGDIALEFTGDVARWRDIAAHNGIDDPRTLRTGTVLEIPATLIPGYQERLASRSTAREGSGGPSGDDAVGPARRIPVKLTPVVVNRDFELSPLDGRRVATQAPERTESDRDGRRVRVIGSYFPKGIYAQPAVYSKLLMRVAPGTLFELESEIDDWYGVVLEDGIGYLRDVDGRVLEAADASRG